MRVFNRHVNSTTQHMEAAVLKKILELQQENLNMKRAIIDATEMLSMRSKFTVPEDKKNGIASLIQEVNRAVADLNNKAKPETVEED